MTTEQMRAANREFRGQAVDNFNKQMRDLSSSVQIALGPLSGVASRLTAFAQVVRRNDLGVAGLVGGMVGFTVALGSVLRVGQEAERQLLAIDGQIEQLGLNAVITSTELNDMAHRLAASTLTSAQAAREAQSVLLEFGNISTSSFENVLLAAQGLSQTFGGGLAQNARRLGRLLENPIENFSALTRQGIQFTEAEKERITVLQRTGRITEAQNVIMERFNSLINRAKNETGGLAGQMDAFSDNSALVAESLYNMGGVGEAATDVMLRLNQAILEFKDSEVAIQVAKAFGMTIRAAGNTLGWLIENVKIATGVLLMFGSSSLLRTITATVAMIGQNKLFIASMANLSLAFKVATGQASLYTGGLSAAAVATRGLTLATRALLGPIGVALALGELLGVTDFFGFHERAREANEAKTAFDDATSSIREMITALEQSGGVEDIAEAMNLRTLEAQVRTAESSLSGLSEKMGEVRSRMAQIVRDNAGQVSFVRTSDQADEYAFLEQRLASLSEEREYHQNILENGTKLMEDATKAARDEAKSRNEQRTAIENMNNALNAQIETIRSSVDSEGQRIDRMKETLAQAREQLSAAEALEGADQDRINQLKQLIPQYEAEIETLRANSRERREATREAQRLIRAQTELGKAISESSLVQQRASGQLTQFQYEQALAMAQVNEQAERQRSSLSALNRESLNALVSTSGLSDEQKQQILSMQSTEAMVDALVEAYKQLGIAANNANLQISGNELFANVVGGNNPLVAMQQAYVQEYLELVNSGLDQDKIEQATKILAQNFTVAYQNAQAEQNRQLSDLATFSPLTETEQLTRDYEERLATLRELQAREVEGAKETMDALQREYNRQKVFSQFTDGATKAANIVEGSMQAMTAAGRENTREYKLLALAQTAISQGMAIAKIWADHSGNPVYASALTALAAAQIGGAIATINSAGYKDGGYVSGKGSSRSDSIPARLSNGEFVMQAKAVKALGVPFLNTLNNGSMPSFNTGGYVGASSSGYMPSHSTASVVVIDQSTRVNDTEVATETTFDAQGQEVTRVYIRDVVREATQNGEMDRTNASTYGLRRRGVRR